jgi:hypothetical protein
MSVNSKIIASLWVGVLMSLTAQANEVQEAINSAVASMSEQLPMQVDDTTLLSSVSAETNELVYHLTVYGDVVDELSFQRDVKKNIMATVCKAEAMQYLFVNHVKISYRYQVHEGSTLTPIVITSQDCK